MKRSEHFRLWASQVPNVGSLGSFGALAWEETKSTSAVGIWKKGRRKATKHPNKNLGDVGSRSSAPKCSPLTASWQEACARKAACVVLDEEDQPQAGLFPWRMGMGQN